jgi:hypothetical protein
MDRLWQDKMICQTHSILRIFLLTSKRVCSLHFLSSLSPRLDVYAEITLSRDTKLPSPRGIHAAQNSRVVRLSPQGVPDVCLSPVIHLLILGILGVNGHVHFIAQRVRLAKTRIPPVFVASTRPVDRDNTVSITAMYVIRYRFSIEVLIHMFQEPGDLPSPESLQVRLEAIGCTRRKLD